MNKSLLITAATLSACAIAPAFAQGKRIVVSGEKAVTIFKALQQAHVMAAQTDEGTEFFVLQVDCSVSGDENASQCFLSLNRGRPASLYKGKDAARIDLALEGAGASHNIAMGKRGISVSALDAGLLTATFTDALVSSNE